MKLITVITSNMFLDLTSREKQENQGGGFTPKERILNVDLKLGQRVVFDNIGDFIGDFISRLISETCKSSL